MKIKEAANQLHTTPRTIRFYEEKGLIQPEKGENEYRYYNETHLWRLQAILALREIGMSTSQIKEALENGNEIETYLNVQRSALYEQWLQMKDMITTVDDMLEKQKEHNLAAEDLFKLSKQLKELKQIRNDWEDKWNFDNQAHDYDENIKTTGYRFNVHEHYHEALVKVESFISPMPDEIGVDIGTGTGNLASLFLEKDVEMIGVDQSEEMLKVCKEKHPEIDVRHGHFLALPLMDGQADFIVTSYALHHIPDTQKLLALKEMDRVIGKNGRIAIADLMFEDEYDRNAKLAKYEEDENHEALEAIHDEYYADRSLLLNWLKDNGYQVECVSFNPILYIVFAEKI
ncbi:MerR family transcriptional regulator [Pontibacillus yanchengensis]|uniref:MerR family transcriptional regulator n=2 Tax=Pontibacillus yanchengensis TaxID=462910 RepID=A0ACC7VGI3_9BACI|nr:MerR family transcriptional regulator [Pontibacillus yanchengensis]MYL32453.1 MerR family transcriptional regulator [Pontibacillus yanchengensis]MYL53034.1 MerR family transcriptional regulator [Pontibacillus yanchengensis]